MFNDLYDYIKEPELFRKVLNIMRPKIISGEFPDTYNRPLYIKPNHSTYDFTESYYFYLQHNSKVIPFSWSIVDNPSYIIFKFQPVKHKRFNLTTVPAIVRTLKFQAQILTDTLENSYTRLGVIQYMFNFMTTEIYQWILQKGFNKQLYMYKVFAHLRNESVLDFSMRCDINEKSVKI